MGLEVAEIIMEVEDVFGIDIGEDELIGEGDVTVGDLHRYIINKLRAKGEVLTPDASAKCLSSAAFYVFRRGLCAEFGLDRKQVRPSTPLDDLVPKADRHRRWRALGKRLELDLPNLKQLPALLSAIGYITASIFAAGIILPLLGLLPPMSIWAFVIGSIGFGFGSLFLIQPLAVHFPRTTQTVRDMVLRVLALNPKKLIGVPRLKMMSRRLDPDVVWEVLRAIVVEILDVAPYAVTRKARFARDLGAG